MPLSNSISRRRFLQSTGVAVSLPMFESLVAQVSPAAEVSALATTKTGLPLRMAFLSIPNGVNVGNWTPNGVGSDYQLNQTMEPLAHLKPHFQVLSGLEHKNGTAGADGAGDHARANATILTGARPRKTAGADIRVGVSVDQVAAEHVREQTRLPSLELSCDGVRTSGACDSGYSCAYQFNVSWRSETTPMTPESNPRLVFERLFGKGEPAQRQQNFQLRQQRQSSILDFVRDDAQGLYRELGRNDQNKLDEYLTGVREIERQIEKAERFGTLPQPDVSTPSGVPEAYQDHIRLMFDMLLLAFQTDSTRVATFMLAHDGSNRSFKEIGISDGHHSISHHQDEPEKLDKIGRIDRFYTEQLAYFLERLNTTQDADGSSLLHNSMVVYASGLSDGNRHRHDNLPVILAGHGGGTLTPGRHVAVEGKMPMTNLYVSMLDRMGVRVDGFGDSDGRMTGI